MPQHSAIRLFRRHARGQSSVPNELPNELTDTATLAVNLAAAKSLIHDKLSTMCQRS
jgi:hypothetical protein